MVNFDPYSIPIFSVNYHRRVTAFMLYRTTSFSGSFHAIFTIELWGKSYKVERNYTTTCRYTCTQTRACAARDWANSAQKKIAPFSRFHPAAHRRSWIIAAFSWNPRAEIYCIVSILQTTNAVPCRIMSGAVLNRRSCRHHYRATIQSTVQSIGPGC